MRYIINNSTNPYYNIALEEYCLMNVDVGEDYFILWQNEPSIIIGRNQNPLEEINMKFVEENRVKVVRRISGGGAVYHDLGNLNFTFITELKSGEKPDFRVIAEPIIRILRQLGVDAMIMGRNDIKV
jgi:lipoate-protein ligase A